jgi:hypothetical protein
MYREKQYRDDYMDSKYISTNLIDFFFNFRYYVYKVSFTNGGEEGETYTETKEKTSFLSFTEISIA